jgi:Centromere DNA-binding protein complex CBF3 subunit, domain 2
MRNITDQNYFYLGNWDRGTQEVRYSSKVPLTPIRVMAGFEKDEAYCVPRTRLQPPEKLLLQVFPFIEIHLDRLSDYQRIRESDGVKASGSSAQTCDHNGSTAKCVLSLWKELRVVLLQDAAAMLVLHPDRAEHRFFRHPIFKCYEFAVSIMHCIYM